MCKIIFALLLERGEIQKICMNLLEVLNNNILSTYFLSHPKRSYKNYDSFLHFPQKIIQKRRLCPPFKYIEKIAGLGRGFGLEKKRCSISCGIAAGGDFPPNKTKIRGNASTSKAKKSPTGPTEWTPTKTWVSISSIAPYLGYKFPF